MKVRTYAKWRSKRRLAPGRAAATSRFRGMRPILAFIGIFAIALQSFVVQTHIHNPQAAAVLGLAQVPSPDAAAGIAKNAPDNGTTTSHGKFSSGDDTSNCRLCQELFHAGRFIAPSSTVLLVPLILSVWLIVFAHSAPIPRVGAYIWRSRAPPVHSRHS